MLLLGACQDPPRDQPASASALIEAAHIRHALGQAMAVVAQTTVSVHRKDHDEVRFDLNWWCSQDGRVKVIASQHDVDFISAVVTGSGSYQALMPRDALTTSGTVAVKDAPWLLTALPLVGSELLEGPIPNQQEATQGPGPDTVLMPVHDGLKTQVILAPARQEVASKRFFGPDDAELLSVVYQRYQAFDEIRRASVLSVSFPDGTEATIYVRQLRSVGRISDEGMHLHLPANPTVLTLPDFMSRLEHLGN
jgi:hypothetical protein